MAPMDTGGETQKSKRGGQNVEEYQDCYLEGAGGRQEGEGWKVQRRGGWSLWRRTRQAPVKSLSGPCGGFTGCPHPAWPSVFPRHAISEEDTRLR